MEKQAHRHLADARRLNKALRAVKLHDGNGTQKSERNELGERRIRKRRFLTEHLDHFGRLAPSSRPSEPLKKARHRGGGIHLCHTLKSPDIDAKLHRHGGAGHAVFIGDLHFMLCLLTECGRQIAVMDVKHVPLAPFFGDLAQGGGDVFGFLTGV